MQLVLNEGSGTFSLSRKALHRLRELRNPYALKEVDIGELWTGTNKTRPPHFNAFLRDMPRHDPQLIQVIKELGAEANGPGAQLRIVNGPSDYYLREDGGREVVESESNIVLPA